MIMNTEDNAVVVEESSEYYLQELFVDAETKALIDKWKTGNEIHKRKEFKTSMLSDEEYMHLKEVFKVLHNETEDYKAYKKAFNELCKAAHIVPAGTIITKYELSKGKDEDRNDLYVEYTDNIRPMKLPEGTKLYHQSVVGGIKELIPRWKLRGKNENGYLCDKPRVYLTMSKSLPRISTDNKLKDKIYTYEVLQTPAEVYVDPLLPDIFQKAVYVETSKTIPVKPVEKETLFGKIKDKITGEKKEDKEEDKKVSEMTVNNMSEEQPMNESSVSDAVKTAAKGLAAGVATIGASLLPVIVSYVVAVVILCFLIATAAKAKTKKMNDFIKKNPKIKSSIEVIVKKVQDLLNKVVKDKAFTTRGCNGFNHNNLKFMQTEDNYYRGVVGEFDLYQIEPDNEELKHDDLMDHDYGFSFELDTPEKKQFAETLKTRYNEFKDIIDQLNEKLNSIPNGDLVKIELEPEWEEDPVYREEDEKFISQCIVYVVLLIKFKNVESLEQTKEVIETKEKLKKKYGKITESSDFDDVYSTICEAMNMKMEPVNEIFGLFKKEKKKRAARKYDLLTEEEFNKCMSIIKKHVNKYSILKDIVSYSGSGIYSTYSEYKNFNSDGVCVAILEWGNDNVSESKMSEYEKQYDSAMKGIESDFAKLPFKIECSNVSDSEWDIICIDVRKPMEKKEDKVNESVESVNEVFGLSKEEKEKKATDRKALSDLEFSYDKKYNAFCLSVSGYSIEKLQTMLDKKSSELEEAKSEKRQADGRQEKLAAQIKVNYLENVCNKCKAMIRKKESYHK